MFKRFLLFASFATGSLLAMDIEQEEIKNIIEKCKNAPQWDEGSKQFSKTEKLFSSEEVIRIAQASTLYGVTQSIEEIRAKKKYPKDIDMGLFITNKIMREWNESLTNIYRSQYDAHYWLRKKD